MSNALDFAQPPTILVVDDTPDNLSLISGLLKDSYKVKVANNGERALKQAQGDAKPDLILLDIMMPGMDGYEVCRRLIADPGTRDIPIIFLTAKSQIEDEAMGFELGASDYITKPVSPPILFARIKTQLQLKASRDFLRDQSTFLEAEVARRIAENAAIQEFTIYVLASVAEIGLKVSPNRIQRTQRYVGALIDHLIDHVRFAGALAGAKGTLVYKSAPLYDIGKVGIPDAILLKREPLTPEELEVLKTHTTLGHDALVRASKSVSTPGDFIQCAREVTLSHEERWDGSGYPQGLSGDDIPVAARLVSIADAYDMLIGEGLEHEQAMASIAEGRGTRFDPDVADAFAALSQRIREIAATFADSRSGR